MSAVKKEEIPHQICSLCKKFDNLGKNVPNENSDVQSDDESNKLKCQRWLEDSESNFSSEIDTNSTSTYDTSESDAILEYNYNHENNIIDQVDEKNHNKSIYYIRLVKCKNVSLGCTTHLHETDLKPSANNITENETSTFHKATNQTVLEKPICVVKSHNLRIISRREWLAQPPLEEKVYLKDPAKFIIISHTASEDGFSQAENVLLIRLIQTFHIESKKWNDIAYNFLVGSDGNVYEGRGWGVVGAHTYGYNNVGLGISFVGCFINKLPPPIALHQAKQLINYGIEIGKIDKNYMLVGHCQCSSTTSPGGKLFEEIQSWHHWTNINEEQNPTKS